MKTWINFLIKNGPIPEEISNDTIWKLCCVDKMQEISSHKSSCRVINKTLWEYIFTHYGGGPVLVFRVPLGLSREAYLTGEWTHRYHILAAVTTVSSSVIMFNIYYLSNRFHTIGHLTVDISYLKHTQKWSQN
jgi:hypothetical protein